MKLGIIISTSFDDNHLYPAFKLANAGLKKGYNVMIFFTYGCSSIDHLTPQIFKFSGNSDFEFFKEFDFIFFIKNGGKIFFEIQGEKRKVEGKGITYEELTTELNELDTYKDINAKYITSENFFDTLIKCDKIITF